MLLMKIIDSHLCKYLLPLNDPGHIQQHIHLILLVYAVISDMTRGKKKKKKEKIKHKSEQSTLPQSGVFCMYAWVETGLINPGQCLVENQIVMLNA